MYILVKYLFAVIEKCCFHHHILQFNAIQLILNLIYRLQQNVYAKEKGNHFQLRVPHPRLARLQQNSKMAPIQLIDSRLSQWERYSVKLLIFICWHYPIGFFLFRPCATIVGSTFDAAFRLDHKDLLMLGDIP